MSLENRLGTKNWKRSVCEGTNLELTASRECSESGRQLNAVAGRDAQPVLRALACRILLGFQGSLQCLPSHTDSAAHAAHFNFTVTFGERRRQGPPIACR